MPRKAAVTLFPCFSLPREAPVTGFHPGSRAFDTYSGGTVRESHPVVLFSSRGSSPRLPRMTMELSGIIVPHRCRCCQAAPLALAANTATAAENMQRVAKTQPGAPGAAAGKAPETIICFSYFYVNSFVYWCSSDYGSSGTMFSYSLLYIF